MPAPSSDDDRGRHGARHLPGLAIGAYNLALKAPGGDGFLGDRASQTAFRARLDAQRCEARTGDDPFADAPAGTLSADAVDHVLLGGDVDASHLVHAAIEHYVAAFADVVEGFLAAPAWAHVQRIVLGGGFPASQAGGLAVRRVRREVERRALRVRIDDLGHDPDDAALLGWVHLLPDDVRDFEAYLAVDLGGTNVRCGLVESKLAAAPEGGCAEVAERLQWRHVEDAPERDEAVRRMAGMLNGLTAQARTLGLRLAPFVGIACPGAIEPDGRIAAGAQNLPGDWEAPFRLPDALGDLLDPIDGRAPRVVLHNDAVAQGLSAWPAQRDTACWAVLTIGTGLGNAVYARR
jgi:predicted NBD/HSP70 family sugar kinase